MNVKMTKDSYFEMCELFGTVPIDDEIPIEMEDFPEEVQQAISVYYRLRDEWDSMSGTYLGKSYSGISDIFDILEIDQKDRKNFLDWFAILDSVRSKCYNAQKEQLNATSKTP